ncbi:hypothetical protein IQ266_18865 [filamentous cyanobacterium LEGE 11480]|uniref:Uncharacterized protein n=1 Tax=Romeriopsis navalis LEGE 11480 TaxID=2777977 RepID=A0A928VNZ2_9CYAN|nr:hypothetical protein [Romeriopsis navalis]MBE9031800.1 hypothetical protein [Romeriopsis navalis LEGE 11480]
MTTTLQTEPTTEFRQDIEPVTEPTYQSDAHLGEKMLLLIMGGGVGYISVFFGFLPGAIAGFSLTAATAASIRSRGQTILQSSAYATTGLLEVMADISGGATDLLENKVRPIVAMSAKTVQEHAGLLSDEEKDVITSRQGQEVKSETSVIELIIGSPKRPNNCAILARKTSGKTTLVHGVIHHLLGSTTENIVLAGDPNIGTANDDNPPRWGGMPLYQRGIDNPENLIQHHRTFADEQDIYSALIACGDLYHQRKAVNADRYAKGKRPKKFTPVYLFIDEFQTFVGALEDDQIERVNKVFGELIRAAKYQVFFFPILHNDKADKGINTANLAGVNLLLLGSVIDVVKTDATLRNSAQRFTDDFLALIANKRRDYDARFGPAISQKSLGVIHLVDGFTSSDGTEFKPGPHLLRVPNYADYVGVIHDFSGLVETTAVPQDEPPAPTEPPNEIDALIPEFEEWLIAHAGHFEPGKDYSLTKFSEAAIELGWGKRRYASDPHYRFNRELCNQLGGRIDPHMILENLQV